MFKHSSFCSWSVAVFAAFFIGVEAVDCFAAETERPPNVVFIYADDLGYADIGYNRQSAKVDRRTPYFAHTPNIDRICQQGIYLSNYMTHHVCSPSRAGMLTGRHYTEVGSGLLVGGELDETVPNMAKDFKANGYVTGAFGKWHNGKAPAAEIGKGIIPGVGVNAYGFDEWSGFYGGGQDYHTRIEKDGEINWWTNGKQHTEDVSGYATYIIRDDALGFIEKNADKPFFLYVPFSAVHTPYHILNTDLKAMCDLFDDEYPQLAWKNVSKVVSPLANSGRAIGEVLQLRCAPKEEFDRMKISRNVNGFRELVYYTMVYAMDRSVGELLSKVEEKGLSSQTIVVFSSDNGATRSGNNGPFRGHKMTIWEGGIRVPAAIWWPGHLEASRKPYAPDDNRFNDLAQYVDWYPTLIGAIGKSVDSGAQLDGINLYPNLLKRTAGRKEFEHCYYGLDTSWAVLHNGHFKLHYNRVPGIGKIEELYDLDQDEGETTNLASDERFSAARNTMKKRLDEWLSSGEVAISYMPLPTPVDRNASAQPAGDVLEVTAVQNREMKDPDAQGIFVRFGMPGWTRERDQFVHAGDVLEYDICVAEDSDHAKGIFVSPSAYVPTKGEKPLFNSTHGIGLDDGLLVEQLLPKGKWIHCAAGIGDVAPGKSLDMTIGLHNQKPGTYHFYIDNVVIRQPDGTVRAVVWKNGKHTRKGLIWIFYKDRYSASFDKLPSNDDDLCFSAAEINTTPFSH